MSAGFAEFLFGAAFLVINGSMAVGILISLMMLLRRHRST